MLIRLVVSCTGSATQRLATEGLFRQRIPIEGRKRHGFNRHSEQVPYRHLVFTPGGNGVQAIHAADPPPAQA